LATLFVILRCFIFLDLAQAVSSPKIKLSQSRENRVSYIIYWVSNSSMLG
jgi:hypothetical protein